MGVSRTPDQFARKVAQLPVTLGKARVNVARSNARIGRANAEAQLRRDVNASGTVTNAGKNIKTDKGFVIGKAGAKLTVNTRAGQEETFLVKAIGPWQLINNRARPHVISPAGLKKLQLFGPVEKKQRVRKGFIGPIEPKTRRIRTSVQSVSGRQTAKGRAGRATVLKTPYGYKQFVKHPGHGAKRTWQKALDKTKVDISKSAPRQMVNEIARIF